MKFFPHSYNGFLLQQSSRVASELSDYDWDVGGISTLNAQRTNKRPKYSGVVYTGAIKVVKVVLNQPDKDRDELVIAMDYGGDQQHELYSLDEFGRKWYVLAKCVGLNVEANDGTTAQYGIIFEADDPTWILVEESTDTWNVLADEELHTITVLGNQPTNPVFEITVGAPPADYYLYVEYIKNYNPIQYIQTDGIDITNGGWNTAALVAGGKMLASGADVRVIFDGAEMPFWVGGGGWNNAATKIFIRAIWLPGQSMPLRTALAGSGTPDKIEWQVTDAVKASLSKLPLNGIIRVDNEEISYRNLNAARCEATIVARNIRGTSIAAHDIDDVCWWVEHDIRIVYGNSGASAPAYATTYKPIFDLATSTLTSRVYTVFADTAGLRVGSWIRQVLYPGLGGRSRVYSGSSGASANPATDMGMLLAVYDSQGMVKPDTGDLAWLFYHPAYITTVTTTGDKTRIDVTLWPARAALESAAIPGGVADGRAWDVEWNEATPTVIDVTESITNTAPKTLLSNRVYVRFRLAGSIDAISKDSLVLLEIHGVTLVLDSTRVIQVGMSGEHDNHQMAIQIRNNRTDESLYINYPMAEDELLEIDSEAMTVEYKGLNAIRSISWDSIRTDWLRLEPGENELQIFADPLGELQIVTKTHGRAL